MHAPKEIRKWINWMRSRYGKKNGVIKGWFFDNPYMEVKWENSKRNYCRSKEKKHEKS